MTERLRSPAAAVTASLLAAAVLLGSLAGLDPRLAVAAAFGLLFVALVFHDVMIGVCLMAVLAFVDALPAFGGALSLAKVAGGVLALSWLASVMTGRGRDILSAHPLLTYALVLFCAWTGLSGTWAEDSAATVEALIRYAPNVLLIAIVYTAVRERRHAEWLVGAIVAGALLTAVLAVADPAADPSVLDDGRAEGLAGGANELAAALVVGVCLCLAFAARQPGGSLRRALFVAATALCAAGIFLSLSRGGLLALGAALVTGVLAGGRWRAPMAAAALGLVALTVVWFTMFASLPARERVMDMGGGGTGRTDIWTIGWRMVEDRPLLGVGAGNFPIASVHYLLEPGMIERDDFVLTSPKVAHNTVLQVLAETGIPGAALFCGIVLFCLGAALVAAQRFERAGDRDLELLARGVFAALVGYLVAAFFISENYSKVLWMLFATGPALLAVAPRASSSS
jgi:O-antigen ligase